MHASTVARLALLLALVPACAVTARDPTPARERVTQRAAAEPSQRTLDVASAFAAMPQSDLRDMRSCLGPGESAPERLAALPHADRRHILRAAYGFVFMDALPGAAAGVVLWRDLILWDRDRAGRTPMLSVAPRSRRVDAARSDVDVGNWTKVVRAVPDVTGDGRPEACVLAWDGPGSVGRGLTLDMWRLRLQLLDIACAEVRWESAALSWMQPEAWGVLDMQRFVDVDGDGVRDLLMAFASRPGGELRLEVISARDGASLGTASVAWNGAWGPSFDMQTEPLLVLQRRADDPPGAAPRVLANCGRNLLLLQFDARAGKLDVLHEYAGGERFTRSSRLAELGDLDGDGVADIAWSASGEPYDTRSDRTQHLDANGAVLASRHHGAAVILSGRDLTEFAVWTGSGMGEGFGHGLACYPDADGDGLDDLLVSSYSADAITETGLRVRLLSAATGRVLGAWPHEGVDPRFPEATRASDPASPWLEGLGWDLALVPDEDGDGFPEVLVSLARHAGFEGGLFDIECPESAVIWLSSRALVSRGPAARDAMMFPARPSGRS